MKVPFDPIDNIDDRTDVLVEYLSLLETLEGDKALVGGSVAGSLKSWNLFLWDGTVTRQFVNREDSATATSRSWLRDIGYECTHESLVLGRLMELLSCAWHCCVNFLLLRKYNLWREIVLFLNRSRLRFR